MKVHCLVFEGFSDWEIAFILPELKKNSVDILTVGFTRDPIKSAGGLRVLPDATIFDLVGTEVDAVIIPGGASLEKDQPKDFLQFIKKLYEENTIIVGICAATLVLARIGLLNTKKHTSNNLDYLKQMVPSYRGEEHYAQKLLSQMRISSQLQE